MTNDEQIIGLLTEIRDLLKSRPATSASGSSRAGSGNDGKTISYAKLKSGDWGIRSPVEVQSGAKVEVTTKTGKVKHETVLDLIHRGHDRDNGKPYFLYSIVLRDKEDNSRPGRTSTASAPAAAEPEPEESDVLSYGQPADQS